MLPVDIPTGTTVRTLLVSVLPKLHARLVPPSAPTDALTVSVRVDGTGDFTVLICGTEMRVVEGRTERPTLWLSTTARAIQHFIDDATGPRRFTPKSARAIPDFLLSDPRIVKRAALASGRIELAVPDVAGHRLAVVLGFGTAARKPIDPEGADTVIEAKLDTVERILSGSLPPVQALANGDVTVRGNRLLAMQLALAIAPFYPA